MSQKFLGIDVGRSGYYSVLVDKNGTVLWRGKFRLDSGPKQALPPAPQDLEICVATSQHPPEELEPLLSQSRSVWACRPEEAQLAGFLGGQPGLVLVSGLEASVAGIDRTYYPRFMRQSEGSAVWLGREALLGHRSSPRLAAEVERRFERLPNLKRVCLGSGCSGGLGEECKNEGDPLSSPNSPTAEDFRLLCQACGLVLDLAEFPGPEPFCRALVLKAARRLTDLCRYMVGRQRTGCTAASWSGLALKGPLLEALKTECSRYLPELRWRAPRFPAEVGAALLAKAGYDERVRRGDDRNSLRPVAQDVWRVLQRERKPFPNYE